MHHQPIFDNKTLDWADKNTGTMRTCRVNSEDRARGILAAWRRRDLAGLEAQLTLAHHDCAEAEWATSWEQERMELLGVIALRVLEDLPRFPHTSDSNSSMESCFRLLEHLVKTGSHPPI
jgi:hypothetical protein